MAREILRYGADPNHLQEVSDVDKESIQNDFTAAIHLIFLCREDCLL